MKIPWNSRPDFPVSELHGVGQHGDGHVQPCGAALGEVPTAHHTRLKTCHPNSMTALYCIGMVWHVWHSTVRKKGLGRAEQGKDNARYPVSDRLVTAIHAD